MLRVDRRAGLLTGAGRSAFSSVDRATLDEIGLTVLPATADTLAARLPRQLVVSQEALDDPRTADHLASISLGGQRIMRLRDYYERKRRRVMLEALDESWFFDKPLRARWIYRTFKNCVDTLAGILGSLIVCLVIPVVWLAVRLDDGGPLFFRQERVGLHGSTFMIWKFRTMRVDAEAAGAVWASPEDDRVTRLGKILRKSRLDELPQFFNVLRREMSLIGPRPERPIFVRTLGRAISFYDRRHVIKPGVTGWATVRFGYGDSVTDKWRSHAYDLYYLKHRSVLLDLEIMVRTFMVMVLRQGL